jgi:hypothetical protein
MKIRSIEIIGVGGYFGRRMCHLPDDLAFCFYRAQHLGRRFGSAAGKWIGGHWFTSAWRRRIQQ